MIPGLVNLINEAVNNMQFTLPFLQLCKVQPEERVKKSCLILLKISLVKDSGILQITAVLKE